MPAPDQASHLVRADDLRLGVVDGLDIRAGLDEQRLPLALWILDAREAATQGGRQLDVDPIAQQDAVIPWLRSLVAVAKGCAVALAAGWWRGD